jgi:hypothetical protein
MEEVLAILLLIGTTIPVEMLKIIWKKKLNGW